MLFSATLITSGKAVAVITATGTLTAIGKIHKNITEQEEQKTPLKKQLDIFGEQLSKLIGIVCIAVWIINIGHFSDPAHGGFVKGAIYYFKIAVALAVAAVPEGLPAVVTTCLALGTRQMAKEGAIVRSLPSVETLGSTTVICVDKTGTLTTNQMCVKKVLTWKLKKEKLKTIEYNVTGDSYIPSGTILTVGGDDVDKERLFEIAKIASLCNDSKLEYVREKKSFSRVGEPTEAALRVLVEKIGVNMDSQTGNSEVLAAIQKGASQQQVQSLASKCSVYWSKLYEKEVTLEFTRKRKSMSVICVNRKTNERELFVKGAPESVLRRSSFIELKEGVVVPLTAEMRGEILREVQNLGAKALRCMALAKGKAPARGQNVLDVSNADHFEAIEQKLTLISVTGMIDPVRRAAKAAVANCKSAGIRIIVLTGDSHNTALAVCKELGLYDKYLNLTDSFEDNESTPLVQYDKTMSGSDWSCLTDEEKTDIASSVVLLSRVEPIHKYEIVQKLKELSEVVAMTGDGVNDAPALKKADIGVAMGSGTSVAKEASDLILVDDNFATIVSAVRHGRSIYTNTKQFIRYLISSNIGEVCCIFFAAALGIPEALTPVQLLWVNFVTDGLPATALSFNKPEKDCMSKPPRNTKSGLVDNFTFVRYMIIGVYVGIAVVLGFLWWFMSYKDGPQYELTFKF